MRRSTTHAVLIICGIIVVIIVSVLFSELRKHQQDKLFSTYTSLLYLATSGCDEYKKQFGGWPNSLARLCEFRSDLYEVSKDAWKHDIVLVPYKESVGYGELISYGQDGQPGGAGFNRDLIVRFPVKANDHWNQQEAMVIKLPYRLQYWTNWYEDYVKRAYMTATNGAPTNYPAVNSP